MHVRIALSFLVAIGLGGCGVQDYTENITCDQFNHIAIYYVYADGHSSFKEDLANPGQACQVTPQGITIYRK